ncbi:TPA: hypothetical protein ACH3X1_016285 [Trebouxia sp. C0004]
MLCAFVYATFLSLWLLHFRVWAIQCLLGGLCYLHLYVDGVVSSLELSLRLPDPVCLDPRVAPSQGVVQCTYVNWFLPSQAKFRSCYFPAAAHRVQKFLAFKLGCHGLHIAMGRRSGIPRSARSCPHCHDGSVGDELHMVFECTFLQTLRVQYADLFQTTSKQCDNFSIRKTLGAFWALFYPA